MAKLSLEKIINLLKLENTDIDIQSSNHNKLIPFLDENLFDSILDQYLRASYLSHWRSVIGNLILQKRQEEYKKIISAIKTNKKIPELLKELVDKIDHRPYMFSLYKIIILERDCRGYAGLLAPDKSNRIDTIIINKKMTTDEKRCVVAHELGHIIINRLLKENEKFDRTSFIDFSKEQLESIADLLMYYILYDKSSFYQEEAPKFIKPNIQEFKKLKEEIDDKYKKQV